MKLTEAEHRAITRAYRILERRAIYGDVLNSPADVKALAVLKLARLEREVFLCIFVNAQHQLIACEELFQGTLDASGVYPREVVKRALELNAAALIFAHNHPSGNAEPSQADHRITMRLRDALALIDVRVLDHIVVGGTDTTSFAERGLL